MNWFANNLTETVFIIGVILLIVEIAVLGFSTFFLFFAGLASLMTALLLMTGIIPDSYLYALISVSIFTFVFALLLYKPLSNMQKAVDTKRPTSDLIGHSFVLHENIIADTPIKDKPVYSFSGIDWRLNSAMDISKGKRVVIVQIDVGVLTVNEQ